MLSGRKTSWSQRTDLEACTTATCSESEDYREVTADYSMCDSIVYALSDYKPFHLVVHYTRAHGGEPPQVYFIHIRTIDRLRTEWHKNEVKKNTHLR